MILPVFHCPSLVQKQKYNRHPKGSMKSEERQFSAPYIFASATDSSSNFLREDAVRMRVRKPSIGYRSQQSIGPEIALLGIAVASCCCSSRRKGVAGGRRLLARSFTCTAQQRMESEGSDGVEAKVAVACTRSGKTSSGARKRADETAISGGSDSNRQTGSSSREKCRNSAEGPPVFLTHFSLHQHQYLYQT